MGPEERGERALFVDADAGEFGDFEHSLEQEVQCARAPTAAGAETTSTFGMFTVGTGEVTVFAGEDHCVTGVPLFDNLKRHRDLYRCRSP